MSERWLARAVSGYVGSAVLGAIALVGCTAAPPEGTVGESTTPEAESNLLQVVATTSVLCDLTEQIAGEEVALTCLLEPGQDPHTYEVTPADRKAIDEADLVLYGGYNFSPDIEQLIEASNTPAPKVAVYEEAVPEPLMGEAHDHHHHGEEHSHDHDHEGEAAAAKGEEHSHDHEGEKAETHGEEHSHDHDHEGEAAAAKGEEHSHDHEGEAAAANGEEHDHDHEGEAAAVNGEEHDHDHEGEAAAAKGEEHDHDHEGETAAAEGDRVPDPHIWHNAENNGAIAQVIADRLAEIDGDRADTYQQNAELLAAQFADLNTWIQTQVATIPQQNRKVVTTHNAFQYFATAYGVEVQGVLEGLSTEEKPSPTRLAELVDLVKDAKVPAIFAETTTNPQLIETVAKDAEVTVAATSLFVEGPGGAGTEAETTQAMLVTNTCTIVDALGGTCAKTDAPLE